jgi:signal-transduction protein with cAMP-binding, CBS, and nucleotidyltransferase domain
MRHHQVCAVLVIEGDRQLVGISTGRNAAHRVLAEGRSHNTTPAELITPDPDCITPGKTAIEALRLMEEGRYRHLPIIDEGKVVEIVSRFDFSGLEQDRLDEEIGLREETRTESSIPTVMSLAEADR